MKDVCFVDPQRLRVWASWCAVHNVRAELQGALLDAAAEIERLQRRLGERAVNGSNGHVRESPMVPSGGGGDV